MCDRPIVALTAGDVAGIGPEVLVRALLRPDVYAECRPLVICHPRVLQDAINLCDASNLRVEELTRVPASGEDLAQQLSQVATADSPSERTLICLNPSGDDVLKAPRNTVSGLAGDAAFDYLATAIQLAQTAIVDAIATAPLNKAALHAAGHCYPGHTEILAERCGADQFAMMLHLPESSLRSVRAVIGSSPDVGLPARQGLSVAHVTLHTALRSVPAALTTAGICEKTQLVHDFLKRLGCERRAIAVCALNPHGGEGGLFGDEERRIIEPAVNQSAAAGINVTGPLPVDTAIRRAVMGEFDGVVAMYHDQGHIPIKLIGFDSALNITLGLPLIRTSPTHGTAFDRAWNRQSPADASGMAEAVITAAKLCKSNSLDDN